MDFPQNAYVRPVEGSDDLFAFRFDFLIPEGKALEDGSIIGVQEQENGDLLIRGYAAVWEGDDREGENFAEGAFQRGIKSFLNGQAALCYHHKHDKLLGKFMKLWEDAKGLGYEARVDGAIKTHPELGTYYQQIKNGSLKGMSVGGFFKRAWVAGKRKIADVDMTEISVTPVPVHPGTSLAVVAGKALTDMPEVPAEISDSTIRKSDEDAINWAVEELNMVFDRILSGVKGRKESAAA